MRTIKLIAFLLLIAFLTQVFASNGPSFRFEYSLEKATHIFIATEGDEIDGTLTVIESLRGDLTPKDIINIPELGLFKSKESRKIARRYLDFKNNKSLNRLPEYVSGKRMVLFLIEDKKTDNTNRTWKPAEKFGWIPESFKSSLVWIENGMACSFIQFENPGPVLLMPVWGKLDPTGKRKYDILTETHMRQEVTGKVIVEDRDQADPSDKVVRLDTIERGGIIKGLIVILSVIALLGIPLAIYKLKNKKIKKNDSDS